MKIQNASMFGATPSEIPHAMRLKTHTSGGPTPTNLCSFYVLYCDKGRHLYMIVDAVSRTEALSTAKEYLSVVMPDAKGPTHACKVPTNFQPDDSDIIDSLLRHSMSGFDVGQSVFWCNPDDPHQTHYKVVGTRDPIAYIVSPHNHTLIHAVNFHDLFVLTTTDPSQRVNKG